VLRFMSRLAPEPEPDNPACGSASIAAIRAAGIHPAGSGGRSAGDFAGLRPVREDANVRAGSRFSRILNEFLRPARLSLKQT